MNTTAKHFNDSSILITGCNGFVGKNLIGALKASSCRITGVDLSTENRPEGIDFIRADLTDPEQIRSLVEKTRPDYIFHLAAVVTADRDYSKFPEMLQMHASTLHHFFNALKDFSGLFINFGTTEEYGEYGGLPYEEHFYEKSLSPYAVTKSCGTHYVYMRGKNENFPAITVRPAVLFGEYQSESKFIPYVISNLLQNKQLDLSPCEQSRDFLYIGHFIRILLELIKSNRHSPGEIYNIASGQSVTLKTIVDTLKTQLNSKSTVNYGAVPYRKNEIMDFRISIKKIRDLMQFTDTIDSINDIKEFAQKRKRIAEK